MSDVTRLNLFNFGGGFRTKKNNFHGPILTLKHTLNATQGQNEKYILENMAMNALMLLGITLETRLAL